MLSFSPTFGIMTDLMQSLVLRPHLAQANPTSEEVDEPMGLDGTTDISEKHNNDDDDNTVFETAREVQDHSMTMENTVPNCQSPPSTTIPVIVSSAPMDSHLQGSSPSSSSPPPPSSSSMTSDFYADPNIQAIMESSQGKVVRTSQAVSRLYELCQPRGLQPEFLFEEPWPQNFKVRLIIAGRDISEGKLFPNKKAAKEAIARKGIEVLMNDPELASKGSLVMMSAGGPPTGENWVGKLMGESL